MREKFEPCTLQEATHIEMGGKMHELGYGYTSKQDVLKYNDFNIEVNRGDEGWQLIHHGSFPLLGIKPMKKKKQEPIEFEAIVNQDMPFAYLGNVPDGIPLGTKFKCVQILEEEEK